MTEPATERSERRARPESREVVELRAIRSNQPELAPAVDLHLELLELQRRIQGRVPLPHLEPSGAWMEAHARDGRPLMQFDDLPLELSDIRLMVRKTADVLRRHGALEASDHGAVEALGRDVALVRWLRAWYHMGTGHHTGGPTAPLDVQVALGEAVAQVLTLAMRPFLVRCAEGVQQFPELDLWPHAHCPLCGGEPDFSVVTATADRQLLCGRCSLRWKFDPIACPFCGNDQRTLISSFATADETYRVFGCDVCLRYLKAFDARRGHRQVLPTVDAVATLPLDAAAIQRGYHP